MAMQRDLNDIKNGGIKVEGDLGDLQIIEQELSDNDDEPCYEENVSRAISTLPNPALRAIVQTSSQPVFGTVEVKNSENVQFGNNTCFYGPVTIIQSKSGVDNASYSRTEDDVTKEEFPPKPKFDAPIQKHQILIWHKLTFSALCVVLIGGICTLVLVLRTKTEESYDSLPRISSTETSVNTTVVGLHCDGFPVLVVSTILLPITMMLIFWYYSLLTKMANDLNEGMSYKVKKKKIISKDEARNICMYSTQDPLLIAPGHLRIVSRTDWLAQPVEGELDKLVQPVPWVIITHTATESCSTQSKCVLRVRLMQSFHIESRGWSDIGYNFLVGGDGSVYLGRGWDNMGAHTKGYNKYSIGIAFIGTFNIEPPPKQQVEACQKIIQQGVQLSKLAKDYKIFAHRQLMSTLSPGDKVFDIIKEWPHFVKNFTDLNELIPKGY